MTKQVSTAVLAIIVSLFPIGNSISPPVALAQTPPRVVDNKHGGLGGLGSFLTNELIELQGENEKRGRFTQEAVKKLSEKFPDHNIVIAHNGGQVTGNHITHAHFELDVPFGRTIGYEIYLSPKGKPFTFVKDGDGGFQNWAYDGDFERSGNTLTAK